MGSISHHITPLVINSFGGGHTHTNTHTDIRTETILRNQAHTGLWPVHAWFKNYYLTNFDLLFIFTIHVIVNKVHVCDSN